MIESGPTWARRVYRRLLPFGSVAARRMFGGFGVYLDGMMFGPIGWNTLYLNAFCPESGTTA